MTPLEILEKFNLYYVEIQALAKLAVGIAQSEEWQKLCQSRGNNPEMKTHLGDILHYLSEAMDCVDSCVEVKVKQDES
jgi:hypothetical protein